MIRLDELGVIGDRSDSLILLALIFHTGLMCDIDMNNDQLIL